VRALKLAVGLVVLFGVLLPVALVALYRFVEPPTSPLMLLRSAEGQGKNQIWIPLEDIPIAIRATAIAAEDGGFCAHSGIDWAAMRGAVQRHERGAQLAGASTLTMQLVRSLLLWPGRSFVRKGIELIHAPVADTLWGKRRTLELYLNLAEWGPGIYGIGAAAQHWYGVSVAELTLEQVARLYAILPNPVAWDPRAQHAQHAARWQRILRRLNHVEIGIDDPCVDLQRFRDLPLVDPGVSLQPEPPALPDEEAAGSGAADPGAQDPEAADPAAPELDRFDHADSDAPAEGDDARREAWP
jgi:monofunctional biosynthetic peptidoglycan transglycosylase